MKPKTHEENRCKVCVLCLKKVNLRGISETVRGTIKEHFIPDIDLRNWYYPTRICAYCSLIVHNISKKRECKQDVVLYQYKYNVKHATRSKQVCYIILKFLKTLCF